MVATSFLFLVSILLFLPPPSTVSEKSADKISTHFVFRVTMYNIYTVDFGVYIVIILSFISNQFIPSEKSVFGLAERRSPV
jgi:hypothetical protein